MWREQAVRDELYKGREIENLKYISEKSAGIIYGHAQSGYSLRNEYMTLYMMLFWRVYNDVLEVNNNMEDQELLEVTICELEHIKTFGIIFWVW